MNELSAWLPLSSSSLLTTESLRSLISLGKLCELGFECKSKRESLFSSTIKEIKWALLHGKVEVKAEAEAKEKPSR